MAANFSIVRHPNSDNLHLRLTGDFDGSSAMQLVHAINDNVDQYRKIFIHTWGLTSFESFGRSVFIKNGASGGSRGPTLVFTGAYAQHLSSEVPLPDPDLDEATPVAISG